MVEAVQCGQDLEAVVVGLSWSLEMVLIPWIGLRWSWFVGQVEGQVKVELVGCPACPPCLNNRRRKRR